MQATLAVPVEQHDDRSKPRMHDLTVLYPDRPYAAVEVTAAADAVTIEFWRQVERGRWQDQALVGGWVCTRSSLGAMELS
jgi:hypothetical protein